LGKPIGQVRWLFAHVVGAAAMGVLDTSAWDWWYLILEKIGRVQGKEIQSV
jgi:hypothetical protein